MDKRQPLIIDRALTQLASPVLEKSKAARRLEKVLVGARDGNDIPMDDLRRATVDLVDELRLPRYFAKEAKDAEPDEGTPNSGLALLILLILLSLLAALAADDSDFKALIEELLQSLIDSLTGS